MDLIDDLGTDLAFALFVEKKYQQRKDSKELLTLIGNIRLALHNIRRKKEVQVQSAAADGATTS